MGLVEKSSPKWSPWCSLYGHDQGCALCIFALYFCAVLGCEFLNLRILRCFARKAQKFARFGRFLRNLKRFCAVLFCAKCANASSDLTIRANFIPVLHFILVFISSYSEFWMQWSIWMKWSLSTRTHLDKYRLQICFYGSENFEYPWIGNKAKFVCFGEIEDR